MPKDQNLNKLKLTKKSKTKQRWQLDPTQMWERFDGWTTNS